MNCRYLGSKRQLIKVSCPKLGGPTKMEPMHICLHPEKITSKCIPTWDGPWKFPDQEHESKIATICKKCPLFT